MTIRERVVTFGPGQALIGIETRPLDQNQNGQAAQAAASARTAAGAGAPPTPATNGTPPRPAVVLLNAGVVHRVGPHRLTVNLARRFARAGFVAFRFDLAGLGDSRTRKGATYEAAVIEDIRSAMDHLQKATGIDRFILGGLCSGADNSLRVALLDPRVTGLVLLDPYAYRTPGFYLRHYLARVARWRSWVGASRRAGRALIAAGRKEIARRFPSAEAGGDAQDAIEVPAGPQYSRYHPPRQLFAANLRRLIDRGTSIYIAYSGSLNAVYNYAAQFDAAFRPYGIGNSEVHCTFVSVANHTYTELGAQRRLGDALVDWAGALRPPPTRKSIDV